MNPRKKRPEKDPDAADAQAAARTGTSSGQNSAMGQLLALQRSAGNRAVVNMLQGHPPSGAPSGNLVQQGGDSLRRVGPGMRLGEADGTEQTPGVSAPEADAALASGPATAVAEAPAAPATAPATSAAPASPESAPATPESAPATPAAPAGPGPAPAAEGGEAPAEAPPLVLNHRTDMRAPDGSPNSRTTVAMGEVVYFDVGGLDAEWTATAGWPPRRTARPAFAWELPEPGTATITARLPDGRTASVDMTVVGPNSLRMRKESEDTDDPPGSAGAGMWLIPRFGPASVNFGNVEWLEEERDASGVTGFFKDLEDSGVDLHHYPNPDYLRIGPSLRDHAAFLGLGTGPWKDGAFHWVIPNWFRRAGTTGAGTMFVEGTQHFKIKADGTVTVSKQGASVTRTP